MYKIIYIIIYIISVILFLKGLFSFMKYAICKIAHLLDSALGGR